MEYKHNAHDAQYCIDAAYMGQLHVNMNGGSKALMGDQRRATHEIVVESKVINSTARTERFNTVAPSQNTSDALSSSMAGKRF